MPHWETGLAPPMATMGAESTNALAIPVTRFVAPGPLQAMQTDGCRRRRLYAMAIMAAACSWRASIIRISCPRQAFSQSIMGPPIRKKITSTLCSFRHRARISLPVIEPPSDHALLGQLGQLRFPEPEELFVYLEIVLAEERRRLDPHVRTLHLDRPARHLDRTPCRVINADDRLPPIEMLVRGQLEGVERRPGGHARLAQAFHSLAFRRPAARRPDHVAS